ncbi:MAG: anaerobic ribonucleoside-triphosphate reductase activating protein [Hespellia sp.]|nr:anaerobic ribonucleoside-triphosphate reductase activating protein [Hespellia sp.]
MYYHNITKDDMLNGDGLRVVLWVSGCSHGCKNCQNPVTWDPEGGIEFDEAARTELFEQLEKDYTNGITFSGGDPLHPANIDKVTALAKEIRTRFPDKTQWLYTGSEWAEVKKLEIVNYLDVVVDGEYIDAERDPKLHWKGSANQNVIDVQDSLRMKKTVLHDS